MIIGEATENHGKLRSKWSSLPLLKFKGETHLLTCSGTGGGKTSGKTTSVTIPNFLNYPHSLVVLDPKTDIGFVYIKVPNPPQQFLNRCDPNSFLFFLIREFDGIGLNPIKVRKTRVS